MYQVEKGMAQEDKSRRTIFIVVAIGSALLVAGLVYIATRPAAKIGEQRLEGAMRPDSPEFAQYREHLVLEFNADNDAEQAPRPLGDVVITMYPTIRNFTGRTLTGLELRAVGYDISKQIIQERYVIVIPKRQPELATNKVVRVPIKFEGIKNDNIPTSLSVELSGVKFK